MLQIKDLVFDAWGRRFFDGATVTLPVGAKVGLVGRNGAGKSTLFKLILDQLHPTGGGIVMPKAARIVSVDQEHPASPVTLMDTVLAADVERETLLKRLEAAPPEEQGDIHGRLIEIGADRAPSRVAEILSGLGFTTADLSRPLAEFSGGWRMRVALAAALFGEPELMLLDEPTNYLDLEGALWLEARLKRYPNTAIVISHDRELLTNAVDHILHLNQAQLDLYTGGYDDFERLRGEKLRLQSAQRVKQEAERVHLQSFVDRFRAKASKATQAQSRLKRLEKMQPIAAVVDERTAPFHLPSPKRPLPPPLVRLEGASVGYDGRSVLKGLNLRLDLDDRIGLLGVNGSGKSTFAKMIAGALPILSGHMHRDRRLTVGWFHQHQIEALDPDQTPLELIRQSMPTAAESQRRSKLAQFGLGVEKAETPHKDLSGGERARLLLNIVAMQAPDLLILDEPTNHLDIDSRRALLDALNDYEGAVILITHDRSLMEMVADRLWLVAGGGVAPGVGDLDDYAKLVLDRARAGGKPPAAAAAGSGKEARRAAAQARAELAPLKKAADEAEQRIVKLTASAAKADEALSDPNLFRLNPLKAADLGKQKARALALIAEAEAEWLEAAERYEAAKATAGV
jgi:ATP-binding cassette subfamily F protein 3